MGGRRDQRAADPHHPEGGEHQGAHAEPGRQPRAHVAGWRAERTITSAPTPARTAAAKLTSTTAKCQRARNGRAFSTDDTPGPKARRNITMPEAATATTAGRRRRMVTPMAASTTVMRPT